MPSQESGPTWLSTAVLFAILAGVLLHKHGVVGGLYIFSGFLFCLAVLGISMRIVLAIGWKQRFIRRFELLALPYCAAYLVWSYTSSNTSSIPGVAMIGIGTGLFIGLVSLFSASRVGQNVDAWESRFFAAIAKKFRRDNDES